jgi:CxxC motif-containing protein (DUF1111 family)
LLQASGIDPMCAETVPAEANVVTQRLTTPIFGAGLIEAIPDEEITKRADPDDADHDGVSGVVHLVPYPGRLRIGRFGWKAQEATLLAFVGEAMVTEMGITNSLFPGEIPPGGTSARLAACEALEGAPEPEDTTPPDGGFVGLVAITNFNRLLAPPTEQRRPRGRGWRAFRQARCDRCHAVSQRTAPSPIAPLSEKTIYPFSDFLLHDMGALGDGIADVRASPTEMRTAPLWGLAQRTRYLHDGRTSNLRDAIVAHDGEAAGSRDRFLALPGRRQAYLLSFLAGL